MLATIAIELALSSRVATHHHLTKSNATPGNCGTKSEDSKRPTVRQFTTPDEITKETLNQNYGGTSTTDKDYMPSQPTSTAKIGGNLEISDEFTVLMMLEAT